MQMKQDITDAGDADVGVNRIEDKERRIYVADVTGAEQMQK